MNALKAMIKGVTFINIEERHMHESDVLVRAMEQRLDLHLDARVHASKHFNTRKKKWVRSVKTSGLGKDAGTAASRGSGQQHVKNSRSVDQI